MPRSLGSVKREAHATQVRGRIKTIPAGRGRRASILVRQVSPTSPSAQQRVRRPGPIAPATPFRHRLRPLAIGVHGCLQQPASIVPRTVSSQLRLHWINFWNCCRPDLTCPGD
ncbi:unnamed protein product [Victoria cruziana]